MGYNIIIWDWVECRHLDYKTYDDLPLREKISLSFVSQGISLAISGQEASAGIASSFTQHSMDRNSKAINHSDLNP